VGGDGKKKRENSGKKGKKYGYRRKTNDDRTLRRNVLKEIVVGLAFRGRRRDP